MIMSGLSGNRNILITGGTSGLGLELVNIFLAKGYNVIALGRQQISFPGYGKRFSLYTADFSDLGQVSDVTKAICDTYDPDIVINNAGILSPPDNIITVNGLEYTFQVNFLSHLLLNEIILHKWKKSHPLRIVAVMSPAYRVADMKPRIPDGSERYSAVKAYSSSKLYQVLMCEYIANKYGEPGLDCFSFNPGTFRSAIYRMQKPWFRSMYRIAAPFMRSPAKVAGILFEAVSAANYEPVSGSIYDIRNGRKNAPVLDINEKEEFMQACYQLIEPFI
jgi:NAD(P)-dependent dehydrogenase (short-subunit alcohol dehydrogenase family)